MKITYFYCFIISLFIQNIISTFWDVDRTIDKITLGSQPTSIYQNNRECNIIFSYPNNKFVVLHPATNGNPSISIIQNGNNINKISLFSHSFLYKEKIHFIKMLFFFFLKDKKAVHIK